VRRGCTAFGKGREGGIEKEPMCRDELVEDWRRVRVVEGTYFCLCLSARNNKDSTSRSNSSKRRTRAKFLSGRDSLLSKSTTGTPCTMAHSASLAVAFFLINNSKTHTTLLGLLVTCTLAPLFSFFLGRFSLFV